MICKNCGNILNDMAKFCNNCGCKVETNTELLTKTCCICGKTGLKNDCGILFIDENNNEKNICENCAKYIDDIDKRNNDDDVKTAVKYFRNMVNKIEDEKVKGTVIEMIGQDIRGSVSNEQQYEYQKQLNHAYNQRSAGSVWINGLKVAAWVIFAFIFIAGFFWGFDVGEAKGVLIAVSSFAVAFFVLSGMMVYIDMAADIREIKERMQNKN